MNPSIIDVQAGLYAPRKPPPIFPHGDDVKAVVVRRRKRRTKRPLPPLPQRPPPAPLPASQWPPLIDSKLSFRCLAAYATLRTLSLPLRLAPFTPNVFLRALSLPTPNRLLGDIHVALLRVLSFGSKSRRKSRKRKLDHLLWPLRAFGQHLDGQTWPLYYDDYCHLVADQLYHRLYHDEPDVDVDLESSSSSRRLDPVPPGPTTLYLQASEEPESDDEYREEEEEDDDDDDSVDGPQVKRPKLEASVASMPAVAATMPGPAVALGPPTATARLLAPPHSATTTLTLSPLVRSSVPLVTQPTVVQPMAPSALALSALPPVSRPSTATPVAPPSAPPLPSATTPTEVAMGPPVTGATRKVSSPAARVPRVLEVEVTNEQKPHQAIIEAYIRGHPIPHRSEPVDLQEEEEDDDEPESDDDESSSASSLDDWPQFVPIREMRKGKPYHLLSIEDKLRILEFLIDEVLATPQIAELMTQRYEAESDLPFGPRPTAEELEAMENEDYCAVCREDGELLCCDGCVLSYHKNCVGMRPVEEFPEGKWLCPECCLVDPAARGPLRSLPNSSLRWFTLNEATASTNPAIDLDAVVRETPDSTHNTTELIVVHGFVMCRKRDAQAQDPLDEQTYATLDASGLKALWGAIPMPVTWPFSQIPQMPEATPQDTYLALGCRYDPFMYINRYRWAPLAFSSPKEPKVPSRELDQQVYHVSNRTWSMHLTATSFDDRDVARCLASSFQLADPAEPVRSFLRSLESKLRHAHLLELLWEKPDSKNASFRKRLAKCKSIASLAQALLKLVDAIHPIAFLDIWFENTTPAKPKDNPLHLLPSVAEPRRVVSTDLQDPKSESDLRQWRQSTASTAFALMRRQRTTFEMLVDEAGMEGLSSPNKRKHRQSRTSQNCDESPSIPDQSSAAPTDSEARGSDGAHDALDGRRRGPTRGEVDSSSQAVLLTSFAKELHLPYLKELRWPVAGRKLFDPIGYLPPRVIRRLARNAGSVAAPFVVYSDSHEVGQVALCHTWRKRVSQCQTLDDLALQLRVLESNLNEATIRKCAAYTHRSKGSSTVHTWHQDLRTGEEHYQLVDARNKRTEWVNCREVDPNTFVRFRVSLAATLPAKCPSALAEVFKKQRQKRMDKRDQCLPTMKPVAAEQPPSSVKGLNAHGPSKSVISSYQQVSVGQPTMGNGDSMEHRTSHDMRSRLVALHCEKLSRLAATHGNGSLPKNKLAALRQETFQHMQLVDGNPRGQEWDQTRIKLIREGERQMATAILRSSSTAPAAHHTSANSRQGSMTQQRSPASRMLGGSIQHHHTNLGRIPLPSSTQQHAPSAVPMNASRPMVSAPNGYDTRHQASSQIVMNAERWKSQQQQQSQHQRLMSRPHQHAVSHQHAPLPHQQHHASMGQQQHRFSGFQMATPNSGLQQRVPRTQFSNSVPQQWVRPQSTVKVATPPNPYLNGVAYNNQQALSFYGAGGMPQQPMIQNHRLVGVTGMGSHPAMNQAHRDTSLPSHGVPQSRPHPQAQQFNLEPTSIEVMLQQQKQQQAQTKPSGYYR